MVRPSVYHIQIISEMYEKEIQEDQMSQRLGEGNSRGSAVLELMRRNFKRSTCLRRYEKEIQEDQMSQTLLKEIQVDQISQTL